MKEMTTEEALRKAAALCSATECCPADILQKLQRWGMPERQSQDIVEKLTEEGFIDEERYCLAFVHDKLNYNKWGRRKIREALRLKGLEDSAVAAALRQIDPDVYERTLKKLLESKSKEIKAGDTYERNGKLMRFAMGRGFEPDRIARLLPDYNDEPT